MKLYIENQRQLYNSEGIFFFFFFFEMEDKRPLEKAFPLEENMIAQHSGETAKVHSKPCQISKMERFAIIVNDC